MSAGEAKEPSWMMRNRNPKELYEDDYTYISDSGIPLRFEQGGGAKDVGQTTWDGAILLAKYFEHAQTTGSIDFSGRFTPLLSTLAVVFWETKESFSLLERNDHRRAWLGNWPSRDSLCDVGCQRCTH
mmetsp:Transcript_26665/g.103676  ORF Transcript_26665/g.103676 Transcript_26665/m.103676 type:complete len:128 (+) Transcript_26665:60-443(+)